jgi:tetratricopeptide (TPR) repeat protein
MSPTIQNILEISPENPLAWKCLVIVRAPMLTTGIYQPGPGEPRFFDQLVKKAMELHPDDVDLVVVWSRLLRTGANTILSCMSPEFRDTPFPTRVEEADSLMATFAKNHPDSSAALLADYEYRRQNRLLAPEADTLDAALVRVQELDPNNPALMMYTGMFYEQMALRLRFGQQQSMEEYRVQRQEAIDQFEKMIETSPRNPAGYLQLAALYAIDGERDKQIATLERANKATHSNDLAVIIPLVSAYLENNDTKNADRVLPQIRNWVERNRVSLSREGITSALQIATLLEGQSLALAGRPVEAIARFRSVFEPVIPDRVDIRMIYTSMMIYAQQLARTFNLDSAAAVYEQMLRHLDSEVFSNDPLNPSRIDSTYRSLISALIQLGQMDRMTATVNRYVDFLRKSLAQNPDNPMIRLALASFLFQQTMNQPVEQRNWSEINALLEPLLADSARVLPHPWQVDFLRAAVKWEEIGRSRANIEEVLIPLRIAENRYNSDLLFLVTLEEAYHSYHSRKDADRVLGEIQKFENGLPYWYLIKATRAEQQGDTREVKRLMDEALNELPENLKGLFLSVQETLEQSPDPNTRSIVRERQALERLRDLNGKEPTIPTLFQQGLMELDLGNTATVARLEIALRKLEGDDPTLSLLLEGNRMLQEAVDAQDPKLGNARICLQRLTVRRPHWEYTHLLAADIADKMGNELGVIDALVRAMDAGNRDPFRYRDLINLYLRSNQEERARTVIERGTRMFPNLPAIFHLRLDHPYQSFYKDFARAIRRDDADTARQIAETWLALAEKNHVEERRMAEFHSIIGQNFFGMDQLSDAGRHFAQAAKSGGETVLPLARHYAHTGKVQEAMQMIHREMTQSQTPERYFLPILAIMRDYDYDPAWVEPFDAFVLEFQPSHTDDPGKLYQYIEYWVIREKQDMALPFYRRLYELLPGNTTVMNDLGYMIAFQQTGDEAARAANINEGLILLDKAWNLEENNANLIDTKGLIVLLQGQPGEAVTLFEKAVELSNQAIIYRLHLAVALLRDQQKDRAEEEFAAIRAMLVPQMDLLPESNRNYTRELLEAFPE